MFFIKAIIRTENQQNINNNENWQENSVHSPYNEDVIDIVTRSKKRKAKSSTKKTKRFKRNKTKK